VLTDDLAFQRMHYRKISKSTPCLYTPDEATDDDDLPLQTRANDQNKTLLKIAILIASNASTQEITRAIMDPGASCCVTPHIFTNQPTSIQNTTLKGIAGGLADLDRGTIQLKV
jgi:hypothetical protein